MTRCSICNRELTNPKSIELGIGPICRGKRFQGIQLQITFAPMERCIDCGQFIKKGLSHYLNHTRTCKSRQIKP